jgi:hypothetical protein
MGIFSKSWVKSYLKKTFQWDMQCTSFRWQYYIFIGYYYQLFTTEVKHLNETHIVMIIDYWV